LAAPLRFYEFFAGGGMARAGLGSGWDCAFANDFDPKKAAAYARNWGGGHIACCDVAALTAVDLPGAADLVWASFPCQDLSLAGARAGLGGPEAVTRSGTFWPFWRLMRALRAEGRAPRMVVLENVVGALRSHGGQDFAAICGALAAGGYRVGALVIDAVDFLPQSRPRVFFVAADATLPLPSESLAAGPDPRWHPQALAEAQAKLDPETAAAWLWWRLPAPPLRRNTLADVIEEEPAGVCWNAPAKTARILDLMGPIHRARVVAAQAAGGRQVGTLYRRTRPGPDGQPMQRAEVRFDGVAGCLRTPSGGSSRQTLLVVEGEEVRSRLLSPREAARLMGLPDSYRLPERYGDAYHLAGDGVCVPVVRHLSMELLAPVLGRDESSVLAAE
jgi:DNA (cytosine-5)-methyltransferase 1